MSLATIVDTLGGDNAIRVTELGKIKIGGKGEERKSQSGGTYRIPQKHDHFTITTMNRNPAGDLIVDKELMGQLIEEYGDDDKKLRQIPVRVLSDDIDEVLQAAHVWYGGKTVAARSDGKDVTWFYDWRNGSKLATPITEPWKPEFAERTNSKKQKLFKLHSVFNCVIAAKESRFGGVYKFRTTSIISFKQLYASLINVHQLTGGVLIGMPLVLVVRPVQVAPEGKATTVYVVHAELRGAGLAELQQQAVTQMQYRLENKQRMMEAQKQYKQLLLAPGQETNGEAADISEEFCPELGEADEAPKHYDLIDDEAPAVQATSHIATKREDGRGHQVSPDEETASSGRPQKPFITDEEVAVQMSERTAAASDGPTDPRELAMIWADEMGDSDKLRSWMLQMRATRPKLFADALATIGVAHLVDQPPEVIRKAAVEMKTIMALKAGVDRHG